MAAKSRRPTAITRLGQTPSKGKRNWLVYADSGKGKTVLSGTAADSIFLTVEAAGTESAKAFGSTSDEWVTDTWAEFELARKWLQDGGYNDYNTVIVDSLSEVEEVCWKDTMQDGAKKNKSLTEFTARQGDYPIVWNKMKRLVDDLNRLPINVIYTAQTMRLATEDEDGDDSFLLLPLVGSPKRGDTSQKICGKVTAVGYLLTREDDNDVMHRRLWFEGTPRMFAKDRHDAFGRYLDDPTIPEMHEMVDKRIADGARRSTKPSAGKKKPGTKKKKEND